MNDIKICTSQECSITCVPNIFIDRYMHNANGEFVKIYLYLLRALSQRNGNISISQIADKLELTENDVRRSLLYWEKKNLLHLEYDNSGNISCINVISPEEERKTTSTQLKSSDFKTTENVSTLEPVVSEPAPPKAQGMDLEGMARFKETEEGSEILFISERYMGHPLGLNEINTIYSWYEELHFSADLIEYLVEYCVEKGHSSIYYMNKVALNWIDEGIDTVEKAKQTTNIHCQSHYSVMKAMGIQGRSLVKSEVAYIDKWVSTYGFSLDIINEACGRTIQSTGKASFKYADSILSKWHDNGIHHLEDISRLDEAHEQTVASQKAANASSNNKAKVANSRFHNFEQREYSDEFYEDLERRMRAKN